MVQTSPALVSVILPVYNNARYIRESVSSALNQTFDNLEVIVVDDGSSDQGLELLIDFRDPRLKILTQPHSGPGTARNTALRAASGEYIAFLDSDDIWMPQKLEIQINHLLANPQISANFCSSILINDRGVVMGPILCSPAKRTNPLDPLWLLLSTPLVCGSTGLLRSSALQKISRLNSSGTELIYFEENLPQAGDTDFWMRLVSVQGTVIRGIADPLVLYRIHKSSVSASVIQLETSLAKLRENFFSLFPVYDNRRNRGLSMAFHNRYLSLSSLLRTRDRFRPLLYYIKALLSTPAFIYMDFRSSARLGAGVLSQFLLGPSISLRLIHFSSKVLTGLSGQGSEKKQKIRV